MATLFDFLYLIAFLFAIPVLAYKSWRTGKYRGGWAEKFGSYRGSVTPRKPGGRTLMLHCVSVGELLSVRQLVDRLLADDALQLVITTATDTGTARAREIYGAEKYRGRVETFRYPLDFSFAVRRFLKRARPDAIALVELETWPNFIRIARAKGIPIAVINGRMTQRAMGRYRIVGPVMRGMLGRLTWLGVQTQTIAGRFVALGAPRERMEIIPTLKYDTADLSSSIPGAEVLARACGIAASHQLFVGGSTGPGEEEFLLATYQQLRKQFPAFRLAIAPRKPEVVPQVIDAIKKLGLVPILRTDRPDGGDGPELAPGDVLILNTMGELKKLYSLCFASFVGRSLVPLGGSDMIEVAAMGKPCCFGSFTANFAEAVELLKKENAASELGGPADLAPVVEKWLRDPGSAVDMGTRAQRVIAAQRGSTEKYVAKLRELAWHGHPAQGGETAAR